MSKYTFLKTDDGSTGMYCKDVNDILHSKTGALKESFDKFINPAKKLLIEKENIKILDLCSGVGYNLKAVLHFLKHKVALVNCIDTNTEYILLSAFLKDNISDIEIKLLILFQIIKNGFSIERLSFLSNSLIQNGNDDFTDTNMVNFIKFLLDKGFKTISQIKNLAFLHNIYYNYISSSMKCDLKYNEYSNVEILYNILDARQLLLHTKNEYDLVFLDAFSPHKDPTLWTIDFLKLLSLNMKKDSLLLSYSKSSPFRSALLELNFFVGKTLLDNFDIGTIASFNPSYINNFLSESDLKILQSKSGICYKDPNLSLQPSKIILNREVEQKNSLRQSRTSLSKSL